MKVTNPLSVTTWLVVKDPVDFGDLSKFTLSLPGAVMCARPSQAGSGAPGGYASMSFTTTAAGEQREHTRFVAAAGKWLSERGASIAWQYPGGEWHHAGRGGS